MSDPFGHRKYHALYFILGFLIAVIVATLMGCDKSTSTAGVYEQAEPWPVACCQALIPSCMACGEGISEEAWLEQTCGVNAISAEYYGWSSELNEPIWLCQAEGVPQWLD